MRGGKLALVAGLDETGKERVWCERLRFELGMELHRHVPRVRRQLDDLDELAVERSADDLELLVGEGILLQAFELVAGPVALADDRLAVEMMGAGAVLQLARIRAEPHRTAEVVDSEQVAQLVNDLLRRVGRRLGGI